MVWQTIYSSVSEQLARTYAYSGKTLTGSSASSTTNAHNYLGGDGMAIAGFVALACVALLAVIVIRAWYEPSHEARDKRDV